MKRLLILSSFMLMFAMGAFAQKQGEMTVNQYFLQIPEEYLKADVKQRNMWIEDEDPENDNMGFVIPASQIMEDADDDDATVFGNVQLFKKDAGGVLVGMTINMCVEEVCIGQILFLDYNKGKWTNVTEDYAPMIDNDEVYEVLKDSPALVKPVKKGVEIPLAIYFSGHEKSIQFLAECKKSIDGGVVAKMFKWNGENFAEFEYEESPE